MHVAYAKSLVVVCVLFRQCGSNVAVAGAGAYGNTSAAYVGVFNTNVALTTANGAPETTNSTFGVNVALASEYSYFGLAEFMVWGRGE